MGLLNNHRFDLRIWISKFRKVRSSGSGLQFFEKEEASFILSQFCNSAIFVGDVSKHNRFSRASLLAGSDNVSVSNGSSSFLRFNSCFVDPLNAVGAFFHDPSTPDGDVWVVQHFEKLHSALLRFLDRSRNGAGVPRLGVVRELSLVIAPVQVVKPSYLVRTVVRAVSSSDAAVVNHLVQTFVAMDGCGNRTDWLARCFFAMDASNRLPGHTWIFVAA